jgi:hypothetical protein
LAQPDRKEVIDALLAEYNACHKTRDHYELIQWSIGSIFIASALLLLGVSFQIPKVDANGVVFMGVVSMVLVTVWFAYHQHVDPYVQDSIDQALRIEQYLHTYGVPAPNLQTRLHARGKGTGRIITYTLYATILALAIIRIFLALVA